MSGTSSSSRCRPSPHPCLKGSARDVVGELGHRGSHDLGQRGAVEVVGEHQVHRLRLEDAARRRARRRAAGRAGSACSRRPSRMRPRRRMPARARPASRSRSVARPPSGVRSWMSISRSRCASVGRERRVRHAERLEDVFGQIRLERPGPRRLLDHEPEPGGVDAVLPPLARLGDEGRVEALPQAGERVRRARDLVPAAAGPGWRTSTPTRTCA